MFSFLLTSVVVLLSRAISLQRRRFPSPILLANTKLSISTWDRLNLPKVLPPGTGLEVSVRVRLVTIIELGKSIDLEVTVNNCGYEPISKLELSVAKPGYAQVIFRGPEVLDVGNEKVVDLNIKSKSLIEILPPLQVDNQEVTGRRIHRELARRKFSDNGGVF